MEVSKNDVELGRLLLFASAELTRLSNIEKSYEDIFQQYPVGYRYTASGHTKWHYQEKFPSASKRGEIKNCGRIEGLFVLPIHPNTPD